MFNQITLVGNVGGDPQARQVGQDMVLTFTVATNEKRGQNEHTEWFRVTLWGKYAEKMAPYVQRGGLVLVTGSLRLETYQKNDGSIGHSLEVRADSIRLLGGKPQQQRQDPTSFPFGANAPAPNPFANPQQFPMAPGYPQQPMPAPGMQPFPQQGNAAQQLLAQANEHLRQTYQPPPEVRNHPAVQAAQQVFPEARFVQPNTDPQTGETFASPFGASSPLPGQ